jgi:PadR family transcriptional regulator AphA
VPKKLTTTSYAILALLALRSWSAYELSQQMKRTVGEYWPRAERGIYDEPKNLVAHRLATATDVAQGRRVRTVYTITDSGRAALRGWLAQPSSPPQFESETVLRIAFAEHGDRADALRTLADLREHARERSRYIAGIARDYVEGQGPYPERLHVIAVVMRLFADYYDLLDTWAADTARAAQAWEAEPEERAALALDTLAEIAAPRPVTPRP